jgi:hypothetical protein
MVFLALVVNILFSHEITHCSIVKFRSLLKAHKANFFRVENLIITPFADFCILLAGFLRHLHFTLKMYTIFSSELSDGFYKISHFAISSLEVFLKTTHQLQTCQSSAKPRSRARKSAKEATGIHSYRVLHLL